MSKNKFVGVAYWSVTTQVVDWLAKALDVLMPVEKAGLAALTYDCLPGGDQLLIQFGDDRYKMLINDGKGRGVVRSDASATIFVVCLLALRKALGDISVVNDSQETIPTLPRQNYPLYADSWQRVLPVARELGLATRESFFDTHKTILGNMF